MVCPVKIEDLLPLLDDFPYLEILQAGKAFLDPSLILHLGGATRTSQEAGNGELRHNFIPTLSGTSALRIYILVEHAVLEAPAPLSLQLAISFRVLTEVGFHADLLKLYD